MAKFTKFSKLSKEKSQEIIADLCEAIASTHNGTEAAALLTDLLGEQELEMIAKRLRIAELLTAEHAYEDIVKELKTSPSTISRVHTWLQTSGEGYRLVLERNKKAQNKERAGKSLKLDSIKRKYPMFFWPQIMLENWVRSANQKQREQMRKVLAKLNHKTQTYKELEMLLKHDFYPKA